MDIPGVGERIRSTPFDIFNNLLNAPLDRPLLEALVCYYDRASTSFSIGRCNVKFTVADISYMTGFPTSGTLMEVDP